MAKIVIKKGVGAQAKAVAKGATVSKPASAETPEPERSTFGPRPGASAAVAKPISKPPFAKTAKGVFPTGRGKAPLPAKSAPRNVSAFLSSVCSELDMPLGVAVECAEKLVEQFGESAEARMTSETMLKSVQTIQRVLDDVSTFAKLERGKLPLTIEPTDCMELAREVREAYLPYVIDRGVTITIEENELPLLRMDALRVRQMLAILVENSVKYTLFGRIGISFAYFGRKFAMTVEDTGCGMPETVAATVHDPYTRLAAGEQVDGPGLGLAIVKGLAKLMGGDMEISSAPGIGTSVRIVIPGVDNEETTGAVSRRLQKIDIRAPRSRKMRIVVVEGSPVYLAFLTGMLRAMGFTNVTGTSKGMDALSIILTEGADLVVACLQIQDIDVRTLVDEIHMLPGYAQLPIYGITTEESVDPGHQDAGFIEIIKKPITREKLHRIVG